MRTRYLPLLITLLVTAFSAVAQEEKVEVTTTLAGRREIAAQISELDGLVDRALVTLTNTTTAPITVVVTGSFKGPEFIAKTNQNSITEAHYITLAPKASEVFTGNRIRNTFSSVNVEIVDGKNNPVTMEYFFSYADGSGRIPEGSYDLCFEVYEVNERTFRPVFTKPINTTMSQCVKILARTYEPPLLQSINHIGGILTNPGPFDVKPSADGSLLLQWQAPAGLPGGTEVEYTALIAELAPDDARDPNQVIQALDIPTDPLAYYRYTFRDAARIVNHQIMPANVASPLQEGYRYAVQITARSANPFQPLPLQNQGKSPVYTFIWGSDAAGPIRWTAFPPTASHMPFRGMPVIAVFSPYSDSYRQVSAAVTVENGETGERVENSGVNNWPNGPLTDQRNATGNSGLTEQQAQHLPITPSTSQPAKYAYFDFEDRGANHAWKANITLEDSRGERHTELITGNFIAGMDAPVLETPANNSTQEPGTIAFRFKTANEPELETLSPFDVVQASRTSGHGSYDISILEKGVLEVSDTEGFDSIWHHHEFILDQTFLSSAVSGESISWADVAQAVYRNEDASFEMTDTGTYYWRVRWLSDPNGAWDSDEYNTSDTWQFTIQPGGDKTDEAAPIASTDCGTPCELTYTYGSGTPQPLSLTVGESVYVGQFAMEVTEITSGSSGSTTFTGKGVITNFGFIVNRVLVEFSNIKVANSTEGKRVFDGLVKATGGGSVEANLFHLAGATGVGPQGLATLGSEDATLAVPFGWDQRIQGHKVIATIDSIAFNPTEARAKFSFGYEGTGEMAGHPVVFAAEVCIAPGGFRNDVDIYLERDLVIGNAEEDEYTVIFKGRTRVDADAGAPSDLEEITKVSWDCQGFKSLKLGMEVRFPRRTIIPENETTGQVEETGRVSGFMTLLLERSVLDDNPEWGFIGTVSFPKSFQFDFLPGWGFKIEDAIFDFSDTRNDEAMRFPAAYDLSLLSAEDGAAVDDRLRNTWTGFYLKTVAVNAPRKLTEGEDDGEARTAFRLTDMLIDRTGFTGFVSAVEVAEASSKGWRLSLDTVQLGIVQTRSITGRLAGELGAPFFDDESRLAYSSMLGIGTDGKVEYNFQINVPADEPLKMKMWKANMKLESSSFIRFSYSSGRDSKARFEGLFNGIIDLDNTRISEVPGLSMTGIKFQNFGFDTDTERFFTFNRVDRSEEGSMMVLSFASPQHTAGKFPLNIRDFSLSFGMDDGAILPTLGFVTELTLSDVGFSASLGLDVVGEMQLTPDVSFGIRELRVSQIEIDCSFSGFTLNGMLEFYRDDATYGDGVHGRITATLPMGIEGKLEARFGSMGNAANPSSYYNYWYVDGLIKFSPGLPIFSGFAIYGFGGGAYHHMSIARAPTAEAAQSTQSGPSATADTGQPSGITYTPNKDTGLGFMATVLLGTQPKEDIFNMDVTLRAEFSSSNGLTVLEVEGNGYVMNDLNERGEEPPVRANVRFGYYNKGGRKYIEGNFAVFLNIKDIIRGRGDNNLLVEAELYADLNGTDEDRWWFYMGRDRPINKRGGLFIEIPGFKLDAQAYVMVGYGIPADLPPLPERVHDLLYGGRSQLENQETGGTVERVRTGVTALPGMGFAFGAHFFQEMELEFLVFYAKLAISVGVDVNISKNDTRICADTGLPPGANGWYAQGRAYAALEGELGIQLDLFIWKGRFSIIELGAAVALYAQLPNPNYFQGRAALRFSILGGLVKGRCNFNIEFGEKCVIVTDNPLAGLEFISEMKTSDEGDPASVFTEVHTAFNFAMDGIIEIEEMTEDDVIIRRFKPFVHKYTLTEADGTPAEQVTTSIEDDGYLAVLYSREALKPMTDYHVTIEIRAYELVSGGQRLVVTNSGDAAGDSRELDFTSGERPTTIVAENILATYPIPGQQYYLQNEVKSAALGNMANKGFFRIKQQDYLFETETEVIPPGSHATAALPAYNHTFVAKFMPYHGGDPVEATINYDAGRDLVTFDMPELENSKRYYVQLVKRSTPSRQYEAVTGQQALPLGAIQQVQAQRELLNRAVDFTELDANGQRTVARYESLIEMRQRQAGTEPRRSNVTETVLYQFVFGTSRFNSFSEKMATMQLEGGTYEFGFKRADATMAEPFDVFEAPTQPGSETLVRVEHDVDNDGYFVQHNAQLTAINQFYRDLAPYTLVSRTRDITDFGLTRTDYPLRLTLQTANAHVTYMLQSERLPDDVFTPYPVPRYRRDFIMLSHLGNRAPRKPAIETLALSGGFMRPAVMDPLAPEPTTPTAPAVPFSTTAPAAAAALGGTSSSFGNPGGFNPSAAAAAGAITGTAGSGDFRFTLTDGLDWFGSMAHTEVQRALNGMASGSLFLVNAMDLTTNTTMQLTPWTSIPASMKTVDALDNTTRAAILRLANRSFPATQTGYRYRAIFTYHVPSPLSTSHTYWRTTSTVPKDYTINR